MKLERFLQDRQNDWERLQAAIDGARGRPERLGADGVLELGALYRAAAADLALVRRQWPGDPVQARLEALVGRARHLVYDAPLRRGSVIEFFRTTYWRGVAERRAFVAVAAVLLVLPMALAVLWGVSDPAAAAGMVPEPFRDATTPTGGDLGLPVVEQAATATAIFTNNIQVTLLAFAGGVLAGLGTAFVLIYNGTFIGAVWGLAIDAGAALPFVELVTAHGVLELSCIVVTAAAGLSMGWALVEPGTRPRREALAAEARRSVELVLGTMPWLVVAGLVEGFVTPAGPGVGGAIAVGFSLGGLYWSLVWWRGRRRPEPEPA
ncbi:MAG TPA: stage II sporulation protein M [Actinomycetota bacterium]|nr:stage II sporulation protein M [Actinomycetota bacterium]